MQWLPQLWDFLVIHNFSGFATLLAGTVAWIIYTLQKRDSKVNAARIILSEIRQAEERIAEISDLLERQQINFPSVLPINSWEKYSYLFASDFDQDQIEEINTFYNNCSIIEDAVKKNDRYLWLAADAISQTAQAKYIDLIMLSVQGDDYHIDFNTLDKYKASVLSTFTTKTFSYAPQRTLDIIKGYLNKIDKITTSTTGIKLKQLARTSRGRFFLFRLFGY